MGRIRPESRFTQHIHNRSTNVEIIIQYENLRRGFTSLGDFFTLLKSLFIWPLLRRIVQTNWKLQNEGADNKEV